MHHNLLQKSFALILYSMIFFSLYSFGNPIRVSEHQIYQVREKVQLLKTPRGLSAEEILSKKGEFKDFDLELITIDQAGNEDYWFYFEVNSELQSLFLYLPHLHFSLLELYKIEENTPKLLGKGGTQTSDKDRLLKYPGELFDLEIEKGKTSGYLLRANRFLYKTFSAQIISERKLIGQQQKSFLFEGILLGIILGVIIYHSLIYIRTKEQEYLLLSIYMFFLLGLIASISGAIYGLVSFSNPEWNYKLFNVLGPVTSFFSIWFSVVFLGINKSQNPKLFKLYQLLQVFYVFATVFSLFAIPYLERVGYLLSAPTSIFLIYLGIYRYRSGFKPAGIYLSAYIPASISVIILTLYIYGLLEYTWTIHNSLLIGVVLQSIFFSLAVASKIRILKDEKENILTAQNVTLENEVNKRTLELQHSLNNLKVAQKQLIQAEKMASLGELTAGIAHEIQNPLNFVNNFSEVSAELLDELNEEIDQGKLEEVKYILSDLKENLRKITQHGNRAGSIVRGMLEHSRKSEGSLELTDLNQLAGECLKLSYHGLRAKDKSFLSDYKIDLDPNLPKVDVNSQDIGRVLINLCNNAFYAVNEKVKEGVQGYLPEVRIITKKTDRGIELSVIDNGSGIPDSIKDKIFQPFFTTKPTGLGTGLGLSLSYDIIKAHGGEIHLKSQVGKGTEFIVYFTTKID